MIPGEVIPQAGDIDLNVGAATVVLVYRCVISVIATSFR